MSAWLALAAFGALGALARFVLDRAVARRWQFPLGILVVNVSGALGLGFLVGLAAGEATLLLLGTGFLGAYTTFSTWILDSERLARDGRSRRAVVNLLGSTVAGLGAAGAGLLAGLSLG